MEKFSIEIPLNLLQFKFHQALTYNDKIHFLPQKPHSPNKTDHK